MLIVASGIECWTVRVRGQSAMGRGGRGSPGAVSVPGSAQQLGERLSPGLAFSDAFDPLADLLGQPDEKSFGPPDVAEPIHILVLDHFADELRAALTEPDERIVEVLHGEHDA
jgi:hypothetical protein